MKKILTIVFFLTLSIEALAQNNLVNNGNFEDYHQCPSATAQMIRCVDWKKYTYSTPDYFNACYTGTIVPSPDVPANGLGVQPAASGDGYVGLYTYIKGDTNRWKEYCVGKLEPLIAGEFYEVSMSVSLSGRSRYGTNDLGIYFYDSDSDFRRIYHELDVKPQVSWYDGGPIMDTSEWVKLVDTFRADSTFDNMVIGGFLHYDSMIIDSTSEIPFGIDRAYYYIDSVVVRLAFPESVNKVNGGNTLSLYPNPNNGKFILSGSITTNKSVTIDIINTVGQNVYSRTSKLNNGNVNKSINLDQLANGNYMLRVYNDEVAKKLHFVKR